MTSPASASCRRATSDDRLGELVPVAAAHSEHVDLPEREVADPERGVVSREADDDDATRLRDEPDGRLHQLRHARRLEDDLRALVA